MFKRYVGTSAFYPNDLALLQRVFDEICADGNHDASSGDAEIIASTLLQLFQDGMTDEAALLAEMRSRQRDFIRHTG
ncbi:hypothetical protein X759_30890 [Mesorhizobium sp. LSHC420B00]|nr:hypothetical protein X759_30890 [Mesorhizobium sp. LSHC420B00]